MIDRDVANTISFVLSREQQNMKYIIQLWLLTTFIKMNILQQIFFQSKRQTLRNIMITRKCTYFY